MKTSTLLIDGMKCDGCAETVRGALQGLGGVTEVKVDHPGGYAAVTYDPAKVTSTDLTAAVEKVGFRARPQQEA